MSYRSDLSRELAAVGIGGRLRSRIVAEFDDHLACNPDAQLGDPKAIARQFADELGTTRARRAAFVSFGALALAGVLFGAAFVAAPRGMLAPASASNHISWLATFAAALTACAAQVSFVAGGLALVRALRLRRDGVIAGAEAEVIRRRATVGVGAGLVTMVAGGRAGALTAPPRARLVGDAGHRLRRRCGRRSGGFAAGARGGAAGSARGGRSGG